MKETLLRAIYMPLLLYIILQPMYSYLDYLYDLAVKANTAYLTQKAATVGRVTPELRQEVVEKLMAVGFKEDEIQIESNSSVRYRGERIDVTVRVERDRTLFPYMFTSASMPNVYVGHGTIMSEYVD
jgi:N-methylhydantoinase A/oxoprolinase/acetone carboxylase beta subunit